MHTAQIVRGKCDTCSASHGSARGTLVPLARLHGAPAGEEPSSQQRARAWVYNLLNSSAARLEHKCCPETCLTKAVRKCREHAAVQWQRRDAQVARQAAAQR